MSWLPPITRTYVFLRRLESSENLLKDSTEFFWFFCNAVLSPDEFKKNITEWEERSPDGEGFTDADLKQFILNAYRDPEESAQILISQFEKLLEEKQVPYIPDEPDPITALYIYMNLESARLRRLLREQAYSEKTVESFERAFNAFNRCVRTWDSASGDILSPDYVLHLEVIGSFLLTTQFHIKKINGEYEEALACFISAYKHFQAAQSTYSENKRAILQSGLDVPYGKVLFTGLIKLLPWMDDLSQQMMVDCIEAIRKGKPIHDARNLAGICETMIELSDTWQKENSTQDQLITYLEPGAFKDKEEITDAEGYSWDNIADFWKYALGWVEAQLTPSTFKEIVNEREEQAAERRVQRYFFGDDIWVQLPERARRSLISADRDWFNSKISRTESILNELKIASEEILMYGLWIPIDQWERYEGTTNRDLREFSILRDELSARGLSPDLSHFERLCSMQITAIFLAKKGVSADKQGWFTKHLPDRLSWLRRARRTAEHESHSDWSQQIRKFYDEFVGLGQTGIIPEISRILLSPANPS